MEIIKVKNNKKDFLDLLLLADEQEDMIDKYLEQGDIKYIFTYYRNKYKTMLVGTGETPLILSFYQSCGFRMSHRVENFFTDNYSHSIYEHGIKLIDMVYLKKDLV